MQRLLCAFLVLLSLALVVTTGAHAATMTIAEEHISVDVPSGWIAERNYTSGGVVYDLYMEGSSAGGGLIPPIVMLDGTPWPGAVTSSMLYVEMKRELQSLEEEPDITGVVVVTAPTNTTQGGQKAIDCTIRMNVAGVSVTSREVIMANDDWDRSWAIVIMDDTTDWTSMQSTFSLILGSLAVEEKEASDYGILMVTGIAVAVVAAIVVVVLLMRRKKQPATAPMKPFEQSTQQMPPPPPPPP